MRDPKGGYRPEFDRAVLHKRYHGAGQGPFPDWVLWCWCAFLAVLVTVKAIWFD